MPGRPSSGEQIHQLFCGDCIDYLAKTKETWTTIFADPPDNIGLTYSQYSDKMKDQEYLAILDNWVSMFIIRTKTLWMSYNSKWTFSMGCIISILLKQYPKLTAKNCVQTFTFGQHNHYDLSNCYRPILRLQWEGASLRPEDIRIPSWRQEHGDKRANPIGRVPSDVFDFPRVTGNSKQRREWHPTQLHEGLVERCIKLTTSPGESVLDPFAGTGTVLRVCKALGCPCTSIELVDEYCQKIGEEHGIAPIRL